MTWASEVGWITGQTGTISGDIAELFVLYDGLNMSVIDLTQRVIVLEGEVLSINGTLASLPDLSGYTALVADVSDLLTRVGVLESGFTALPDLSGYPTLLADVAQLKLDVAAIQGTLAGLPDLSGYGALVTEVGSLRDDLTALQGTVAALPDLSGYGALVTQVGDHETRIGALESWRAVDEPEIDQLRTDVDALIAGGGGGGGGGGGATVVRLKYPDDFTAELWDGSTLVEFAEVDAPPVGGVLDVFVFGGNGSPGVPLHLLINPSTAATADGRVFPVRVINSMHQISANTLNMSHTKTVSPTYVFARGLETVGFVRMDGGFGAFPLSRGAFSTSYETVDLSGQASDTTVRLVQPMTMAFGDSTILARVRSVIVTGTPSDGDLLVSAQFYSIVPVGMGMSVSSPLLPAGGTGVAAGHKQPPGENSDIVGADGKWRNIGTSNEFFEGASLVMHVTCSYPNGVTTEASGVQALIEFCKLVV